METRAYQLRISVVLNPSVAHAGEKSVMEEQLPQGEKCGVRMKKKQTREQLLLQARGKGGIV